MKTLREAILSEAVLSEALFNKNILDKKALIQIKNCKTLQKYFKFILNNNDLDNHIILTNNGPEKLVIMYLPVEDKDTDDIINYIENNFTKFKVWDMENNISKAKSDSAGIILLVFFRGIFKTINVKVYNLDQIRTQIRSITYNNEIIDVYPIPNDYSKLYELLNTIL